MKLPAIKLPNLIASFAGTSSALVIREREIELVSMRGAKVEATAQVPLEGEESGHLTEALRQAISAASVSAKKLAVSIPTKDVLVRFFTIPLLPKTEWDAAVQFEARKYVPFKSETLVWDYHVNQPKGSDRLEVVFAAVQKERFSELKTALSEAGITPSRIEPRSMSLARLVEKGDARDSNAFICIVDVEETGAQIALMKRGVPYLTRDFTFPSDTDQGNTEASAKESPKVAGSMPGAVPANLENVGRIASLGFSGAPMAEGGTPERQKDNTNQRAKRLLSELSVSMDFFKREHPSAKVSRIIVFGNESVVAPWCAYLSDQLNCVVELGAGALSRHVEGGLPLNFAAAVGLIRGEMLQHGAIIDLARRSGLDKTSDVGQVMARAGGFVAEAVNLRQVVGFAGVAVILLFGLWLIFSRGVGKELTVLKRLHESRPSVGWGLSGKDAQALKSIKDGAKEQLAVFAKVIDKRMPIAGRLDALARLLPDGIWLTGLSVEDTLSPTGESQFKMSLKGACFLGDRGRELSAIQALEKDLRGNPSFSKGFKVTRLEEIGESVDSARAFSYRTFSVNCNTQRRI